MNRPLPRVLVASWLAVGITGFVAVGDALREHSDAVRWTITVEALALWVVIWVATLVPRTTTLTAARIGVPGALVVAVVTVAADDATGWSIAMIVTALVAVAALAHPVTIDAFVDGSSYGPERRFALRTPALTAILVTPPTWAFTAAIAIVPPLAVSRNLVAALVIGVVWAGGFPFTVRSLHLPARRWVVFVPAGMVLSDPLVLTDRVLFPRRNIEAVGPASADTDAIDLSRGTHGLALQLDLTDPFALPFIDRSAEAEQGEKVLNVNRVAFAVLRPGALLEVATERRFAVGATRPAEPTCMHHTASVDPVDTGPEPEVSQTAVPLPRTRSPR